MDLLAIPTGFAVGLIVGVTGVGGGSLMTPLLIGLFKLPTTIAIGTDLCFAGLTKLGGAAAHHRLGHVDAPIVGRLLLGSLPASLATLAWMHSHGPSPAFSDTLTLALGLGLLLTAASVAWRRGWAAMGLRLQRWLPQRHLGVCTVAAGALLGLLVTLSSIGAGALGASLLLLLYPQLQAHRVVGTDIAHAVPLTLVAGLGHALLGHVDGALLGSLLLGSLPGIWLGARLTRSLPERWVRGALCAALLGAGVKVLV